jgi:hypothetical protein
MNPISVTPVRRVKKKLIEVMAETPHTRYIRLDLATQQTSEEIVNVLDASRSLGHGFDEKSFPFFWKERHLWQVLNQLNRDNAGHVQFFAR